MAEYKTFSFYFKKYWPYILIYILSAILLGILFYLYWYYLKTNIDLISNPNMAVIRYNIILGPILIGDIKELDKLVYLASFLFLLNTFFMFIAKFINDIYFYILIIYNFIVELLFLLAFYLLILINLK